MAAQKSDELSLGLMENEVIKLQQERAAAAASFDDDAAAAASSPPHDEFHYFIRLTVGKDPWTELPDSFFAQSYLHHLHYEQQQLITNGSFLEFIKDITMMYLFLEGVLRKMLNVGKRARTKMPALVDHFFLQYQVEDAAVVRNHITEWSKLINQYKHTVFTLMDKYEISPAEYGMMICGVPQDHFLRGTNENLIGVLSVFLNVLGRIKMATK